MAEDPPPRPPSVVTPARRGCGRRLVAAAMLLGWGGGGLVQGATDPLRLVGSDLLGEPVLAVLRTHGDDFEQPLELQFTGTRPALDRVHAGVADLAVWVDYPAAPALPEGWMSVPLGYFTAFMVTSARLPVEQVSVEDLAKLFSADSAVATPRWGDLGGRGEWVNVPVQPLFTGAGDGLAGPLFRHVVLRDRPLKPGIVQYDDAAATLAAAGRTDGALAIVSRSPAAGSGLKVLLVAAPNESVAFAPTAENLRAGDYPLAVALRLAFPRERAGELLLWLRLWHGEVMAEALESCGLVPLPLPVRNQQVFDLELLE